MEHQWNTSGTPVEHLRNTCGTPEEIPNIRVRKDKDFNTSSSSSTSTRARAPVNRNAENLDEVCDFWQESIHGGRLTVEHLSWLANLLESHDVEWVKNLMRETADANGNSFGASPKLLKAVYDRRRQPKKRLKGGEKVVRIDSCELDPRGLDTSWIDD